MIFRQCSPSVGPANSGRLNVPHLNLAGAGRRSGAGLMAAVRLSRPAGFGLAGGANTQGAFVVSATAGLNRPI